MAGQTCAEGVQAFVSPLELCIMQKYVVLYCINHVGYKIVYILIQLSKLGKVLEIRISIGNLWGHITYFF
jgi:hypothetical protein